MIPNNNAGESSDASAQNNFLDDILQASFKELINWTFEETLKASIFIYLLKKNAPFYILLT